MSSIDTYSTTKDLVFDEWVWSHRSDEIRFDVYFDGRFFMCPLKYEDETILDLRLPISKRLSFKEMNDLLLDKTKEDIWKWFYCKPKCTLQEGLTIVENDKDIEKMFEVTNLQGALDRYACPIPQSSSSGQHFVFPIKFNQSFTICQCKTDEIINLQRYIMRQPV
ncbi:hypothetical protein Tco_0717034 [Tanacetum coccineum]